MRPHTWRHQAIAEHSLYQLCTIIHDSTTSWYEKLRVQMRGAIQLGWSVAAAYRNRLDSKDIRTGVTTTAIRCAQSWVQPRKCLSLVQLQSTSSVDQVHQSPNSCRLAQTWRKISDYCMILPCHEVWVHPVKTNTGNQPYEVFERWCRCHWRYPKIETMPLPLPLSVWNCLERLAEVTFATLFTCLSDAGLDNRPARPLTIWIKHHIHFILTSCTSKSFHTILHFHFNHFISTISCKPLHFNDIISTISFRSFHFNHFISIVSFQP